MMNKDEYTQCGYTMQITLNQLTQQPDLIS